MDDNFSLGYAMGQNSDGGKNCGWVPGHGHPR